MKLHKGDCLNIMKSMPDKSVDMIFTSPPFKEEDVKGNYWEFYTEAFTQMMRVTAKALIVVHSSTKMNHIISTWPPKRTLIWGKGFSQMSYRYNPIFIYQISDEYKVNKYIWADVFGVPSVSNPQKIHKYQDPLILYETVIKMFKGCVSVLDPFMGSGTTGVACKRLNIEFTGIEIDKENFATAKRRIDEEPTK